MHIIIIKGIDFTFFVYKFLLIGRRKNYNPKFECPISWFELCYDFFCIKNEIVIGIYREVK